MSFDWLLDGAVATALPFIAWTVARSAGLPRAIVLFIAFGLLSALAWTRLGAIDVALVEASVGTGLSGALVMTALSWANLDEAAVGRRLVIARAFVAAAVALGLVAVLVDVPDPSDGLLGDVSANLADAGVHQPITAVLMNFRGYDTLFEIVVLITASLTIGAGRSVRIDARSGSNLVRALADALLPFCIVLAAYFLWRGSNGPGGAFQGGAVLAGGAVVSMLAGRLRRPRLTVWWSRAALILGPASFLLVALPRFVEGAPFLQYAPRSASRAIFAIELASLLTIALVLASFFPGVGAVEAASEASHRPRGHT